MRGGRTCDFSLGFGCAALEPLHHGPGARASLHGNMGLRVGHRLGDVIHEPLQRMTAAGIQEAPRVGVRVDVHDGLLLQLFGVSLGPLRRPQQTRLLAVPTRVHQGALRAPPTA